MLTGPTFHLEDDPGVVLAHRGGHLTLVGAPVLEAGVPQHQGGVAVGHQLGEDGASAGQLTPLVLVFALVLVFFFFFFGVSAAIVIVVVPPLELEDGHVLSEPLDGLPAGRREAAGQQTLLRHHAGHHHVCNNTQFCHKIGEDVQRDGNSSCVSMTPRFAQKPKYGNDALWNAWKRS